jgi:hypothetical protein
MNAMNHSSVGSGPENPDRSLSDVEREGTAAPPVMPQASNIFDQVCASDGSDDDDKDLEQVKPLTHQRIRLDNGQQQSSFWALNTRSKQRVLIGALLVAAVTTAMYGKRSASAVYRWLKGTDIDEAEIAPEDLADIFKDLEQDGVTILVACDGCSCDNCTCDDCTCQEKNACMGNLEKVVEKAQDAVEQLTQNLSSLDAKAVEEITDHLTQAVAAELNAGETISDDEKLLEAAQVVVAEMQNVIEELALNSEVTGNDEAQQDSQELTVEVVL